MSLRRAALLLCLALAVACAHVSLPEDRECERLHARLAYCLLAPVALADVPERLDRVTVDSPEGRQQFVGQVGFSRQGMTLAGQSATGMGLFRIEWDGERLEQHFRVDDIELDGRRLLALIQLVFASSEALQTAVIGGRVMDARLDDGRERRLLLDDGREVATIHYSDAGGDIRVALGDSVRIHLSPL